MTLLEALKELQTNGPEYLYSGICINLTRLRCNYRDYYEHPHEKLLSETFKKWPKFSGNINYPVPTVTCSNPEVEYNHEDDMWSGAHGDLRKELLQFCIDELSKEVSPQDEC